MSIEILETAPLIILSLDNIMGDGIGIIQALQLNTMLTGTLTHLTIKNCPNWWKAKKPVVRPKTVAVEEMPAVFAYHALELIVKSDRAQDAWKEVE